MKTKAKASNYKPKKAKPKKRKIALGMDRNLKKRKREFT